MPRAASLVLLVLAAAAAAPARGAPPAVPLRLVAAEAAVVPGASTELGVVLSVPPGWHAYWDGLNDSGFAPRLTWNLPAGFRVGEPAWPVPQRHVSPGDILDHVLVGEVVALVPLAVPADLAPGARVALRCQVEWLVCRDVCVPGRSQDDLTVDVAAGGQARPDSTAAALLDRARARLPRPLPADAAVRWSRRGSILEVEVPGAARLTVMPRRDSARPVDLLAEGEARGERLRLRLRPEDAARPFAGVLAVSRDGDAVPVTWSLEIPGETPPRR